MTIPRTIDSAWRALVSGRGGRLALVCLFTLAFLPRIAYVFYVATYDDPREWDTELVLAARTLAEDGYLGNVFFVPVPSAHLSPLYPMLAAAAYTVTGAQTDLPLCILAVLVSSFSIMLLPLVAREAGLHPAAGYLAGGLMAVLPLNLWVETSGDWEQPYTGLWVLMALWLLLRLGNHGWQGRGLRVCLAAVLATGALLSPMVLVGGVAALGMALLLETGVRARVAVTCAVCACAVVLALAPWTYRNYQVLGAVVPLRSNLGLELRVGNEDGADGTDNHTHPIYHPFNNGEQRAEYARVGEYEYMQAHQRAAVEWIQAHPQRFAALTLRRARLFFFPGTDMWIMSARIPLFKASVMWVQTVLGLVGLLLLFSRRNPHRWFFVMLIAAGASVYLFTHVRVRYRYPITGILFLLSAHAVCTAVGYLRRSRVDASLAQVPGTSGCGPVLPPTGSQPPPFRPRGARYILARLLAVRTAWWYVSPRAICERGRARRGLETPRDGHLEVGSPSGEVAM